VRELHAATKPHAAICALAVESNGGVLVAEMDDFKPPKTTPAPATRSSASTPPAALAPYLRNRGTGDAHPASTLDLRNGFERPIDIRIGPDGLIYVHDYGAFNISGAEPKAFPKTGNCCGSRNGRLGVQASPKGSSAS
jgi:glucose/arabinose dehydrogenase